MFTFNPDFVGEDDEDATDDKYEREPADGDEENDEVLFLFCQYKIILFLCFPLVIAHINFTNFCRMSKVICSALCCFCP